MFKLNLRSMCLILCMFFLTLAVALIYADTGTAAATPWWAELLTAAVPALVIFITKEIRSHVKDQTIERLATYASTAKKYEPVAADVLAAIEAKYPALKADVTKVETLARTSLGQAAINAGKEIVENVAVPVPPNPPAA